MQTIPLSVIVNSDLITNEESYLLIGAFSQRPYLSAEEILALDLPAKNRVEALLRHEFLTEKQLRKSACDFAEHVLHVFEELAPEDFHPRACVQAARLYADGVMNFEMLRIAVNEARPSMQRFRGTEHIGAFEVGWAVISLDGEDAMLMAQEVAVCAQKAAHRKVWENRKCDLETMIEREKEAVWQLKQIVDTLGM
ncbi:MAG TPA: hypothetical protein VN256_03755 [Pyrinomonadaceae bacterium]|nr:hypothetical protein [Pyrinomonadaceae bacterium]